MRISLSTLAIKKMERHLRFGRRPVKISFSFLLRSWTWLKNRNNKISNRKGRTWNVVVYQLY